MKFITPFVGAQVKICEAFGFQIPDGCAPVYVSKAKQTTKRRGRPAKPKVEKQTYSYRKLKNSGEIGVEEKRILETVPARVFIIKIIRHKVILKSDVATKLPEDRMILNPALPLEPIERCIAGASVLTDIIIGKFMYHLPFYRQIIPKVEPPIQLMILLVGMLMQANFAKQSSSDSYFLLIHSKPKEKNRQAIRYCRSPFCPLKLTKSPSESQRETRQVLEYKHQ